MIDSSFFIGLPKSFKGICNVYPPTVREVLADPAYSQYIQILTISQEEIEDLYTEQSQKKGTPLPEKFPTPMELMLANSYNFKPIATITKAAFKFFIHQDVDFLYDKKMIIVGGFESLQTLKDLKDFEKLKIIKEEDYFDFQNLLRKAVGAKQVEPPDPDENPYVKQIKAKGRYRDKIIAKKQAKEGMGLGATLAAVCCMGIGITPLNIGELSYSALSILIKVYQNKEKYDIDIRSLLAGADKKKVKPKYWIGNLED